MFAVKTVPLLVTLLGLLQTQITIAAVLPDPLEFTDSTAELSNTIELTDTTENNTNSNAVSLVLSSSEKLQILQTIWAERMQHRDTLSMDTVLSIHKLIYEHLLTRCADDTENTETFTEGNLLTWDMHNFLSKIENLEANASDFVYLHQLSEAKRQKIEAEDLYQQVHDVIVEVYGQRLANVLARMSAKDLIFYQQLIEQIYSYDPHALEKIYEYAIDWAYSYRWAHKIADLLHYLGANYSQATHSIVVEAQLYLFWKFQGRRDINDAYLLNVGYFFNQYHAQSIFNNSEESFTRMVQVISLMPATVTNLISSSEKCLKNVRFREYMYGSPVIDQKRNYVFTWHTKRSDKFSVMKLPMSIAYDETGHGRLMAHLFSTSLNGYIFRDIARGNKILVWSPTAEIPANSTWTISMKGNYFILRQNDYYLCASSKYDVEGQRRWVEAALEFEHEPSNCEWIVDNCPDN